MAIMYPKSIAAYKATSSERQMYRLFEKQLSDDYHIFFSVKWTTNLNGIRENSESDFLVFNKKYGYITIEVKGGESIEKNGDRWTLILDDSVRNLNKSPYTQAESSMYYFKEYFREETNQFYQGVFGAAVAFPRYKIPKNLGTDAPKEITIDMNDLNNLENKMKEIMFFWRGQNKNTRLSKEQRDRFIAIVNKRIAISAAAGALIEYKTEQLEKINRVQDNYLDLLCNYSRFFLAGGAGTGKTWIALKRAIRDAKLGLDVLIMCTSSHLALFFSDMVSDYINITVKTIDELADEIAGKVNHTFDDKEYNKLPELIEDNSTLFNKYDSIVIDEAQDFSEEWAFSALLMLKDFEESRLFVFYDKNQNILNRDFGDKFYISTKPFILKENLRNTANIYSYAVDKTGLGSDVYPNSIEGVSPDRSIVSDIKTARSRIGNILEALIIKESVDNTVVTVVSDRPIEKSIIGENKKIANWKFTETLEPSSENQIRYRTIKEFKGLESDVIIFIRHDDLSPEEEYVVYTRARFYLYEVVMNKKNS